MKRWMIALMALALFVLPTLAQESNLREGCVEDYDAEADYFPDKVELTHAERFQVDYFSNYKVLTVTNAFDGADDYVYVLTQCGTPAPDAANFPESAQFIEVPSGKVITLSTTQLPNLVSLDLLDELVGVDSFDYVNTPEVVARIDEGQITAIGSGATISIEQVMSLEPSLVLTYGYNPDTDAHPALIEAGIVTALDASWREGLPLGRAEWIKFTSLFYNAEAEAEAVFDDIVSAYEEAQTLAATVPADERPVVLWNTYSTIAEAWSIPGANTYLGAMIEDAGGEIALGDLADGERALFSTERVYEGALDADVWVINTIFVRTVDDLVGQDSRYADFAAVQSGNVWNNDGDVNENGGNNYYERGVTSPHLVLQDLVAIFHPDLMPDHEFAFFRPLDAE